MHAQASQYPQGTGLVRLLAHYVAGDISDAAWRRITNLLDAAAAAPHREALARFLEDALRDLGPGNVKLPKVDEAEELISEIS